ncbi:hypothetical protein [uncultured Corynebacterium sp.]|uniref:SWIM zinc finger family protein n=1 Tax=uncultured Corynebacterium sp. TaxID=159447 RepID=UPI0028D797B1|nr:hypothetical protein [uncultured Corynebacterium sp.]
MAERFDGKGRRSSRRSPQADNVIYVNFGARDRAPVAGRDMFADPDAPSHKPRRKPTRARAKAKGTRSTAADWLTDLAFAQADSGRMSRGRGYYQGGHVINMEFVPGSITAKVIGSQPQPFSVAVMFPPRTDPQLARLPDLISQLDGGIQAVRSGQFSPDMLKILFGGHPYKARYYCDCPDKAKVCKHIVATMMAAADRVATDPGLVFQLRGLNLADMRLPKQSTKSAGSAGSVPPTPKTSASAGSAESAKRAEAPSPEAIAAATDRFWNGGPLPEIPQLKTQSALADSDEQLLHKAMRTISYTSVDELCAVSDIEDLYYNLTHET